MTAPGCPGLDELLTFSVGRAVAPLSDDIAGHLQSCASCVHVLQVCPDEADPLLQDLRQKFPGTAIPEEMCQRVLSQVQSVTVVTPAADQAAGRVPGPE